jgi:2-(1,2-epoxy-1,2-dihydrophenyl)acetyl-CoA isomerase
MEFTRILWEVQDGVGIATLNRPERLNALDVQMINELNEVVSRAGNNAAIRALLLTGSGRGFSSGADVKDWNAGTGDHDPDADNWVTGMHKLMTRLYRLPKPVIAAVNGVAVGGGCDLTLVADFRIGSTAARFGEVYIRVGYCPDAGGSFLLPRLIGPTRAAELIYTGRIIDGLLSALVEPEELMPTALAWATRLASGPTIAIGLAKENIRQNWDLSFEDALRNERRAGELCGKTEDHREGLAATVERREAKFVGR